MGDTAPECEVTIDDFYEGLVSLLRERGMDAPGAPASLADLPPVPACDPPVRRATPRSWYDPPDSYRQGDAFLDWAWSADPVGTFLVLSLLQALFSSTLVRMANVAAERGYDGRLVRFLLQSNFVLARTAEAWFWNVLNSHWTGAIDKGDAFGGSAPTSAALGPLLSAPAVGAHRFVCPRGRNVADGNLETLHELGWLPIFNLGQVLYVAWGAYLGHLPDLGDLVRLAQQLWTEVARPHDLQRVAAVLWGGPRQVALDGVGSVVRAVVDAPATVAGSVAGAAVGLNWAWRNLLTRSSREATLQWTLAIATAYATQQLQPVTRQSWHRWISSPGADKWYGRFAGLVDLALESVPFFVPLSTGARATRPNDPCSAAGQSFLRFVVYLVPRAMAHALTRDLRRDGAWDPEFPAALRPWFRKDASGAVSRNLGDGRSVRDLTDMLERLMRTPNAGASADCQAAASAIKQELKSRWPWFGSPSVDLQVAVRMCDRFLAGDYTPGWTARVERTFFYFLRGLPPGVERQVSWDRGRWELPGCRTRAFEDLVPAYETRVRDLRAAGELASAWAVTDPGLLLAVVARLEQRAGDDRLSPAVREDAERRERGLREAFASTVPLPLNFFQ